MSRDFDPRRIYWLAPPLIGLCIVTCVGILVASTSFTYSHWQAPEIKFQVTRDGRVVAPDLDDSEQAEEQGTPVATTVNTEHGFPVMNPLTTASHEFVVRNDGDGPLLLRTGPTTCKCTVAKLGSSLIPPGKEGRVRLVWNTGRKPTEYTQTAVVYTNDPKRREIEFKIFGQVRVRLAALPSDLAFGNLAPGQPQTRDVTLITRHWDRLEFISAESSIKGLTWELVDLDPAALAKHQATDALQLRVRSPERGSGSPHFSGVLTLRVRAYNDSDGEPTEETVQITVRGKHLGRLGIYGSDVNALGQVDLGKIDRGETRTSRLVLRVRDPDPELNIQSVEVTPRFVRAEVNRHETRAGTYFIDLTVPSDAPDFIGSTGTVRIEVDHPRIASPELQLDFSVLDFSK